ncbi:MAG: outer membrane beta-barrel protein [Pseudomonadota bacterium]
MTLRFFLAAALACAAPATAVQAASSGLRGEVIIGYDNTDIDIDEFEAFDLDIDADADGFLYGGRIGYDLALPFSPKLSVGVDAEVTDSTGEIEFGFGAIGEDFDIDVGRDLYIGGRVSYDVIDRLTAYGTVGYTNLEVLTEFDDETLDGIRLGAGLQFQLLGSIYVLGEYRYSNYESDVSRNQVISGIGYRF